MRWTGEAPGRELSATHVDVRTFGAKGNGITDDTIAIQAAIDAKSNSVVQLDRGKTYLVSYAGTKTTPVTTAYRYCLTLKSGVTLDLNGSTIKQANGSNACVFINGLSGSGQDSDFGVRNGTIDCNAANQTAPATGEACGILLYDCDRPDVRDLKVIDAWGYAGRFLSVRDGDFNDLRAIDSLGDGWSFGIPAYPIDRSRIDKIYGEACLGGANGGSQQGNPSIFTGTQLDIGSLYAVDCAGGVKVQSTSADCAIRSVQIDGTNNGTANSGLKVQGDVSGSYPTRITIGQVVAKNCYGSGLHVYHCGDVNISAYVGDSNGTGAGATSGDQMDVYITPIATTKLVIGSIISSNPGTRSINVAGADGSSVRIGSVVSTGATGDAVTVSGTSLTTVGIGSIDAFDPNSTMLYACKITGGRAIIGQVFSGAAPSTTQPRVYIQAGLTRSEIKFVMHPTTDPVEGVATLTNGATSTSVTCGNAYRVYNGGTEYFEPVIHLTPMNASARALGAMSAVIVDYSSGTGFAIKHATAGATDYVHWKIMGWATRARAFA
jgi:hypothetical protein